MVHVWKGVLHTGVQFLDVLFATLRHPDVLLFHVQTYFWHMQSRVKI